MHSLVRIVQKSHRVEGRINHMRQTQDSDRIYHRINGTYTLESPSSSSADKRPRLHTIETRRQRALQVLNEVIDAGPDRTEKVSLSALSQRFQFSSDPFHLIPDHRLRSETL